MKFFENTNFLVFVIGTIYIFIVGICYYIIFHKHHKRNKIDVGELISLVSRFYTRTTITIIFIIVGIYCIINANEYRENRAEVAGYVTLGIAVASIAIINYIFYIRASLVDPNKEEREATKKATIKIGEILEFIIFTIFIFLPILGIPHFINIASEKKELIKELVIVFLISFASIFLMFALNPINIKEKLKKIHSKKLK